MVNSFVGVLTHQVASNFTNEKLLFAVSSYVTGRYLHFVAKVVSIRNSIVRKILARSHMF